MVGNDSPPVDSQPDESRFERVRAWVARPVAAALLTLLLTTVGAIGSAFSAEIRSSLFRVWTPASSDRFDPLSTLFWLALVATALFFWIRQHELDVRRDSHQKALAASTDKLKQLIRTMPPADFLVRLSQRFELCDAAAARALASSGAERSDRLKTAIRIVLTSVANLAQSFDESAARYEANVMTPVDPASLNDSSRAALFQRIRMREPDATIDSFRRVLLVRTDLSTAADSDADVEADSLALGVPISDRTASGVSRVLPGACSALVTGEARVIPDTTAIADELRSCGEFSSTVLHDAQEYFACETGRRIRSVVSVPVLEIRDFEGVTKSAPQEVMAILNVHRDRPAILGNGLATGRDYGSVELILPALGPLLLLLARLLSALRAEEGGGATLWTVNL